MIDYLIIGSGLGGIAYAETALKHRKTIMVIDADLHHSSQIAAGLYNPVVLKRFTALANASAHLELLETFYNDLELKLNSQFHHKLALLRKFSSFEEQNDWFVAADKPELSNFLSTDIFYDNFSGIDSPFGFGKVNQTGYIDTFKLLKDYKNWLTVNQLLIQEVFEYNQLQIQSDHIQYKETKARHIVFAEGFGMHANPFFKELPLDGAKGELLIIKAPDLSLDVTLNSSVFILPLGNDLFKIGATYNWTDKSEIPTEEAKKELVGRLKEILTCDFEIITHQAGVRPTVKDRKPLLGTHAQHKRVHILNGLGTRGVMLAPFMAKTLLNTIELKIPLPREIDIRRFDMKK